nr:hypothetical protein [Tanacetum cinerariifolium]
MDITIDQQVALDEALVPHASRLRIGKSNFRLRSDITSKESTLQLVYDVLRLTPFYNAFLVTVDVPEIYILPTEGKQSLHSSCGIIPKEFEPEITLDYHSLKLLYLSTVPKKSKKCQNLLFKREHLDWITVRKDDDKLYKFKEGDFKRLLIQDIKNMILLLVHGKLTNVMVEERFAFNVSLRMFTRSIVIQRRVEDLQLGVESYQKKLNLTKPDTYRFNLKRKEAYTAYFNLRGFIYENNDKQNRLMQIDELHKFNDGTLNDVRTALDDRLKGIRMKYLPQTI